MSAMLAIFKKHQCTTLKKNYIKTLLPISLKSAFEFVATKTTSVFGHVRPPWFFANILRTKNDSTIDNTNN